MELEPAANIPLVVDHFPHMPEPPPVRLVAVEDVTLPAPSGMEEKLDALYVGLLGFEREAGQSGIVYRAENVRLRFELMERVVNRPALKPTRIEVPSLAALETRLAEAGVEYERMRGITPGSESLLLADPAGNLLEVSEIRRIL